MPIVKTIQGDIVKRGKRGDFRVVVHGCNVFCKMGSGLAPQMVAAWPELQIEDNTTKSGDRSKLGKYTRYYDKSIKSVIINAYIQYDYGSLSPGEDSKVSYAAIASVFQRINSLSRFDKRPIAIPKIGAGLAKGHWEAIKTIIDLVTPDVDIVLVEYQKEDIDI